MKKIVAGVAIGLACVLAVGGVALITKGFKENPFEKKSELTAEGFEMADGIELDIESSALKFTAYMTLETADRLDDGTVNWGILVAPEMYFEQLDTEKTGQVDWVPAFEESELASMKRAHMALSVIDDPRDSGEKVCRIEYNVGTGFRNYNGEFTAIGYIETVTEEGTTYEYASYPKGETYATYGRSFSYLAAEALNRHAAEQVYYTPSNLETLHGIINGAVDAANGEETETKDGSKFAVTLSETEKTLKRKESFTLTAEISPKAELPILWKSSNPDIAEVQDGKVTAKKDGRAVISAYVAGERYDCTVTVGEPEQAE